MTGGRTGRGRSLAALILLGCLLTACQKAVLNDLEERRATEVVSTLLRHGVPASKKLQDGESNTWRVMVPADQEARAIGFLTAYNLLDPPDLDTQALFGEKSTISTSVEEKARELAGKQGDIAKQLESIERVIRAQVVISPAEEKFGEIVTPASASVVIVYQSTDRGTWPVSRQDVQDLVAGAVAHLDARNVRVIMNASNVSAPPRIPDSTDVPVNMVGLVVAQKSVLRLKIVLGAVLLLIGGLAAFAFWQTRVISALRGELSLARTGYTPVERSLVAPPEELPH